MLTDIVLYLNVLTSISITIYICLHIIFNINISNGSRLSLLIPAFSMVCYTLASIEWAYHIQYSNVLGNRWVMWFIIAWLIIISTGIIAHCTWGAENEKGH